jgi:hypothetical protein
MSDQLCGSVYADICGMHRPLPHYFSSKFAHAVFVELWLRISAKGMTLQASDGMNGNITSTHSLACFLGHVARHAIMWLVGSKNGSSEPNISSFEVDGSVFARMPPSVETDRPPQAGKRTECKRWVPTTQRMRLVRVAMA